MMKRNVSNLALLLHFTSSDASVCEVENFFFLHYYRFRLEECCCFFLLLLLLFGAAVSIRQSFERCSREIDFRDKMKNVREKLQRCSEWMEVTRAREKER